MKDLSELSRVVSRVLRHDPWLYELELDESGWTSVSALLDALRTSPRWRDLQAADLELMIAQSAKQRHEVAGGRIRALYGHSLPTRIEKEPAVPPDVLFHGTTREAAEAILVEGLRPMGRQYVHLSVDVGTAHQVGARKTSQPVILEVAALEASREGAIFYRGNDTIWLADAVPAAFIAGTTGSAVGGSTT